MKKRYFIFTIFIFFGLSLNAQQEVPLDKQFYYYKGEKNYILIDFSRISIVSNAKINMDNVREIINFPDFKITNNARSHTRQNVTSVHESLEMIQNEDIFLAELEFSEDLNQTDYFEIIQRLSNEDKIEEDGGSKDAHLCVSNYDLSLYPNPTQTEMTVVTNNSTVIIVKMEIFDVYGKRCIFANSKSIIQRFQNERISKWGLRFESVVG